MLKPDTVPVHTIGSQIPTNVSTGFAENDCELTELSTLSLPIYIAELDVNSVEGGGRSLGADIANNAAGTQGGLFRDAPRMLAKSYAGFFPAFLKNDQQVKGHVLGANDATSWRADGNHLIFDVHSQPKPVPRHQRGDEESRRVQEDTHRRFRLP